MRLIYTLSTILCLMFVNSLQAQEVVWDVPCDADANPVIWSNTTETRTFSGDLTGMSQFDTDNAMPQTFGCPNAENAVFAKLDLDDNTSHLNLEVTGGSASAIKVALISITTPCPAATGYGELLYQDGSGTDLVECDLNNNGPVTFDLCNFNATDHTNIYLWISSASADADVFDIDVEQVVAPTNDDCASATDFGTLNLGAELCLNGETNLNACPGPNYTGACYANFSTGSTVWYTVTTGADVEHISVEVDHTNNADVNLALIDLSAGCGPPPNRQTVFNSAIDDDYCNAITNGVDSITQLPVHPNTTYYILVNTPSIDAGDFDLCVKSYNSPTNDQICNAEIVTVPATAGNNVVVTGNTNNASIFWLDHTANTFTNFNCPSPGGNVDPYSSVFYKLEVDPFSSRIQVFGTDLSSLNALAAQIFTFDDESLCVTPKTYTVTTYPQTESGNCNFDGAMLTLDLCTVDSSDYGDLYLWVGTERYSQGDFEISVQQEIAPDNDECDDPGSAVRGAEDLGTINEGDEQCLNGETNRGACGDAVASDACFTDFETEATVWYQFTTGPDVEMISAEVTHTNATEVRLALFELPGGCGSAPTFYGPAMLDEYCADDSDMDGVDSVWNLTVRANQTYYLAVSTDSTEWGDFDVCVRNCTPPVNDQPCDATTLTLNTDPDNAVIQTGTTVCANPLYSSDNLALVDFQDGCPMDYSTVYYELDVDPNATYIKVFASEVTSGINILGRIFRLTDPCNRTASPPYGGVTYANTQPDAYQCDLESDYAILNLCGLTQAEKQELYLEIGTERLNQGEFEIRVYQEIAPVNDLCEDPADPSRGFEDLSTIDVGNEVCATAQTNRGACPDGFTGPNNCFVDLGADDAATVWYQFTTGADVELITVTVDNDGSADAIDEARVALFELTGGTCAPGTIVDYGGLGVPDYPDNYCQFDAANSGVDSVWNLLVKENTTYFVAVSSDTANWGTFDLCVKNCAPPANDRLCDVENDMSFHLEPGEEDETNRNAITETGTTVCANNFFQDYNLGFEDFTCTGDDIESMVFYKIDVDDNATRIKINFSTGDPLVDPVAYGLFKYNVDGCGTRAYNPTIWNTVINNMEVPVVECNPGPADSLIMNLCGMSVDSKDSIYLFVASQRRNQGEFTLELSQQIAPVNDECENAQEIAAGTNAPVSCLSDIPGIPNTTLFACEDVIDVDPASITDNLTQTCLVDSPGMSDFAGVWYTFKTDDIGELLDITVSHNDGKPIHWAMYESFNNADHPSCTSLQAKFCEQDTDGDGEVAFENLGIDPDTTYYLYVYTHKDDMGEFDVCYDIKELPPCEGNPPFFFNQTTPICGLFELDNYCIDMVDASGYPHSGQQWPGCGGSWALHNPNWFSFIAGAPDLEIVITISDCQDNAGVQVAMYELNCDTEFDSLAMGINPEILAPDLVSDCSYAACNTGTVTFNVSTVVGQLYGIVFDGCNGDICHIEIDVLVGGNPPVLDGSSIQEPTFPDGGFGFNEDTICQGALDVPFMVEADVPGACRFIWEVRDPATGEVFPVDSVDENTAYIDFPEPGNYDVCVAASNYCDTTDFVCIPVLVVPLDPFLTNDTICEGDTYTWIGPFGETLGTYGPFSSPNTGPMTFNTTTFNDYMCEVPAELDLFVRNENEGNPTQIDTFTCFLDLPYTIFGVDIGGPVTGLDVQTISPFTMCDTFFQVDLTVFGGNFFVDAACDGMGNMIFSFDPMEDPQSYTTWFEQFEIFNNDPDFELEVEWTAQGTGGIIGDEMDLTLSQQEIEDMANGDILTLRIQLKMYYQGELFCDPISPPYEFFLSHNFPEILNITGDTSYCPGQDNLKLYADVRDPIAPVGGLMDPVTFYQWYPPAGFTIDSPYTATTDTISLSSPTNPMDSTVCLVVTTGSCMFTDSLCENLEEETPTQPILEPDNETCESSWTFAPSVASSGGWSIIDTPATGNTATFSSLSNPSATVTVTEPGLYTFQWREGPPDCALYDTVSIDFLESPQLESQMDTCYFGVNFVTTIEIGGGTPNYTIDPASTITGSFVDDSTFVSDTIVIDFDPVTGNYGDVLELIIVDSKGCVSDTIEITLVCECDSEIGDMATDTITVCDGDVATANYLGGHTNDGDDTLVYILHTGDTNELETIIDTSLNGDFTFDPGTMTHGTIYYISRVIGNAVGVVYVDLNDPCLDVAVGQPVVWYEVPVADAGNDTTVCGFSYTLSANPSVGNGEWKVVPANADVNIADPDNPTTDVTVVDAGSYTFRWTETNEICQDSADVNVTLAGEIIPLTTTLCNALATEYDITIVLTGGGGDYFIEDFTDSSLVDSLYMVGDTVYATGIPKDSIVTFTINNALGCGPVVLPVTTACICETEVGTFDTAPVLQACSDGCIDASTVNYDTTGQYLDPNDTLSYVMHTSNGDTLLGANFIAQSPTGVFCYSNVMSRVDFGDTVYISVIAGNHIGGGRVDINDPCQQITFGVRAVYNERPVADAGPDIEVCGLDGSLSASASVGNGTWTYVDGPSANVTFGTPNAANSTITVTEFGTHTFAWTEDNFGCDDSDTVSFTFLDYPSAQNISFNCDDIASSYTVTFDIVNGDSSSYSVVGMAGSLSGTTFTSDPIPHDSTYSFFVFDGNQCDSTEVTGSHFCPCITEIGSLTGPELNLCRNEGVSGVSYDPSGEVRDANDGLIYTLSDANDSVLISGASPNFFFNPSTMNLGETYYITVWLGSIVGGDFQFDERCTLSDGVVEVTWHDFPEAMAQAQFDTLTCTRNSIDIDGSISVGVGNGLEFAWTTNDGNISSDPNSATITIDQPGTYTLTVTDPLSGCTHSVDYTIFKSADIPDAIIEEPETLTCEVTEITLDGSQSSSGASIVYEWTTAGGTITSGTDGNTVTVNQPGSYTLTVIDNSNNCRISETVTVEQDIEQPDVQASVSDQLSCSVTEVTLDGSGSSTGSEFNYEWTASNGGTITGSTGTLSTTANSVGDYTLVITNTENGCVDSVTVSVTENPNALTDIDVEANDPRCHNEVNGNISITPTGGEQPITYTLNDGEYENNTGTFTNLGPGTYVIEVTDVNGCYETQTVTLVNPPLLSIDLPESIIIEEGDSVVIEAILPPGAIYDTLIWDTDTVPYTCLDSACTIIQLTPLNTVEVFARVIGGVGCADEDFMKIVVRVVRDIYIPNVFTPNGDGLNDRFLPAAGRRVVNINSMMVFDRWGSLVFESRDFLPGQEEFGWDGTFRGEELRPAVFVYKVEVVYDNGDVDVLNGTITLSR